MNKKIIYCLSATIILILIATVSIPVLQVAFRNFNRPSTDEKVSSVDIAVSDPVVLKFEPDHNTMFNPKEQLKFQNNATYPVINTEVLAIVPHDKLPRWTVYLYAAGCFIYGISIILLIINFIRFTVNITKNKIFELINAKLLRKCAFWLFMMTLSSIILYLADFWSVQSLNLELQGYEISAETSFPWMLLLSTCIVSLMSIIWARGVELREESDLTI